MKTLEAILNDTEITNRYCIILIEVIAGGVNISKKISKCYFASYLA